MAKNSQNDLLVTHFLKHWLYQTTLFHFVQFVWSQVTSPKIYENFRKSHTELKPRSEKDLEAKNIGGPGFDGFESIILCITRM
jgi:hypothetical protein